MKKPSLSRWLRWTRLARFYDALFALAEASRKATLRALQWLGGPERRAPRRLRLWQPALEGLEARQMPSTIQFQYASLTVHEADGAVSVPITSSGPLGADSLGLNSTNGTALAGTDFQGASGKPVVFGSGQTSTSVSITLYDRGLTTGDVSFSLSLVKYFGSDSLGSPSTCTVTIDDDDSDFRFSSASYAVSEGVGSATITVERTGRTDLDQSVDYATSDGSATNPADYTATSGTLDFAVGQSSTTFTVPIFDDSVPELNETVHLSLSLPSSSVGCVIDSSLGTATLVIDDNDPPVAVNDTYSVSHDHTLTVSTGAGVLANDTGPSLSVTAVNGSGAAVGTQITLPSGAKVTVNSNGSLTYLPVSAKVYDDSFTYTVSDTILTATATVTIHVTNAAPVAVNDSGFSTNENTTLSIAATSLLANDTDSDGDLLTVTDFTQPSNGLLAYDGTNFTYTPNQYYHGSDAFTYSINDGVGGTATATVSLTVNHVNQPPKAVDHWADTAENTAVTLPVLQGATDPDGDSLDILSYSQGSHGSVSLVCGTEDLLYTPNTSYLGADSFTYEIEDGHGGTATATVHVLVQGPGGWEWANSVLGESSEWTDAGPYYWYAVQALGTPNTFDYGDETTAWAAERQNGTTDDGGSESLTVGFKTADYANGVLVRESYGNGFVTGISLIDTSNTYHALSGVSDSAAPGSVSDFVFTFTTTTYQVKGVQITVDPNHDPDAWEEIDAVELLTASVTPSVNHAPTLAHSTATASVNEDDSVNINLSSLASDSDSDPLLFTVSTYPTNGTVEINDNATPDDWSDDYFTYTPDNLYSGSDSFTYTVTDIWGASVTGTVSLIVNHVNHAPDAEDAYAVTVQGTAVTVPVLDNDSDVDGDTLTVTSVTQGAHGTVTIPSGATTVLYTPDSGFTGIDSFSDTIGDGHGGSATAQVTVLVYPTGEWASSVVAVSSQYNPGDGSTDGAASQALGAPDTFVYGDAATAWAAADADDGTQTLTVGFATPAQATGVIVRESNANGLVTEVELKDTTGTYHTLWTGTDPSPALNATDLTFRFPQTSYTVQAVRISVDTNHTPDDYEEIDAVRLLTGGSFSSLTVDNTTVNSPPSASDDWASANKGQAITVPVLANDSDPDGNSLTVQSVGTAGHGTVTINSGSTAVTYTPSSGFSGSDSFTYTISDGLGGTSTATVHVTVADGQWANSVVAFSSEANDGTYSASTWALGTADTSAYGDASASWSPDPSSTATSETLTLGVGTADYATGVLVRESSGNGFVTKVELRDTGGTYHTVWTGTDATAAGQVQDFVITLTSTTSYQVNAVRITVNPATADGDPVGIDAVKLLTASAPPSLPAAPVAAADSATTAENLPVNIAVQANDTNSAGGYLYLRITSGPSHGTAAVDLHGSLTASSGDFITYWPDQDFSGSDGFVYSLTDAYGQTSSATVSITVSAVNQSPVAGSTAGYTVAGTAVTLNLLANASDPDSDTVSVSSVTQGQHGTVSLSGGNATYTPSSGFTGEDEFSYMVSDGHSHTDTGTARVLVYEAGQWANSVLATSTGRDSADNALGAPNDSTWLPSGGAALEFLTTGFASATYATGVLVREEDGSGAVTKVDLLDSSGSYHTLWSGTDPATSGSGGAVDFVLNFATTSYQVASVRVFIDTSKGSGSLDAIRLLTGGSASSLTLSGRTFDASGDWASTTYNSAGQPTTVKTYFEGSLVDTVADTYDSSGNLTISDDTDADNRTTRTTYDTAGHELSQILAYGTSGAATTTYSYDTNGNRTQVTDPDSNTTTYTYDAAGNQTSMSDPAGHTATQTFDDQNRVSTMTNRNGQEIVYSYDTQGRESEEVWYASDGTTVEDTLQWTYNAQGLVATASNDQGTYTYTYNEQGRVSQVAEPFGVTLNFGYDANGNRDLVKDSFGDEEDSLYNAANQLVTRILTQSSTVLRLDFTYTADGQVATIKRYSNAAGTTLIATTVYGYNAKGEVTSIQSTDGSGNPIDAFAYVYDTAGDLTSETDNGTTTGYGYDGQAQLTSAGSAAYSYDANGNRMNSGYSYATSGNTNELTAAGLWAYQYDAEGNETQKSQGVYADTWEYSYDAKNHLVRAQEWDAQVGSPRLLLQEVDYKYDVYGNRAEKDVDSNGDGTIDTVQRYAYDGLDPAKSSPVGNEVWDVIADLTGSNALQTRYLRGDVVDQIFGRLDASGNPYWLMTDHLGSVRTVLDGTGAVKDRISYDAFGNITSESAASYGGRYKYTGREFDVETQLQYNRGRYYDAETGRWISQDPEGFTAGDSNLYRYVQNSPTSRTDPSGLLESPVTIDGMSGKEVFTGKLASKALNGVVKAYSGRNWTRRSGEKFTDGFEIQFTSSINLPKDANDKSLVHWLQFTEATTYTGAQGNMKQGAAFFSSGGSGIKSNYIKTNEWHIDHIDPTSPYVERTGGDFQLTATSLSMVDKPNPGLTIPGEGGDTVRKVYAAKGVTRIIDDFTTLLVLGQRAFFQVEWGQEMELKGGQWTRQYNFVAGKALGGTPLTPKNLPAVFSRDAQGRFLGVYYAGPQPDGFGGFKEGPKVPFWFDLAMYP